MYPSLKKNGRGGVSDLQCIISTNFNLPPTFLFELDFLNFVLPAYTTNPAKNGKNPAKNGKRQPPAVPVQLGFLSGTSRHSFMRSSRLLSTLSSLATKSRSLFCEHSQNL